jgi:hypothetical protein
MTARCRFDRTASADSLLRHSCLYAFRLSVTFSLIHLFVVMQVACTMCMFCFIAFSYSWELVYNGIVFSAFWSWSWILCQIRGTESVHWWGIISQIRFAFCILSFGWFPGVWTLCDNVSEHTLFHLHRRCRWWCAYTAYEDGTDCFETSAYKIQAPGKHPKERIRHSERGESLKSKKIHSVLCILIESLKYKP